MGQAFRMVFSGPRALDLAELFFGLGADGLVYFGPEPEVGPLHVFDHLLTFPVAGRLEDAEAAAGSLQPTLVEALGQCERCLAFVDTTDMTAAGTTMVILESALYSSRGQAGVVLLDDKRSPSPVASFVRSKVVEMRSRSWIEPLVMVDAEDAQHLVTFLATFGAEVAPPEIVQTGTPQSYSDDIYGENQ